MLQGIKDDGPESQLLAAVTLIRMNVAPVVSVHVPFGSDNHMDSGLAHEAQQTEAGIGSLTTLWSQLGSNDLQDRVSFLSLNVFGRTLKGPAGRAHNPNHHVALMFGPRIKGSVVGGVEPLDTDYGATSIDAVSEEAVPRNNGSIAFDSTLQSMGMPFGAAAGLDPAVLAPEISGGRAIPAALRPEALR